MVRSLRLSPPKSPPRLRRPTPPSKSLIEVSILIVNYNSFGVLAGGLDSLHAHPAAGPDGEPLDYEIIVVDNASPHRDPALIEAVRSRLREGRDRLILHDENGGYAKGMNLAYAHSRGRYLLVSNPDVLYQAHCLTRLRDHLEAHPQVGATAPLTYGDPGLEGLLPTGIVPRLLDRPRLAWASISRRGLRHYHRLRTPRYLPLWRPHGDIELEMFAGWGFLIRRELVESIGFFDERYPLYFEDTDLSLRVLASGHTIVQVADAHLVHLYNQSGKTAPDIVRERHDLAERIFFRRWKGPLGALLVDATRAFQRTNFARARHARPHHATLLPVELESGRPVVQLREPCADFLVEIAFDPYFYLAAACFGKGQRWSPGPVLSAHLETDTYFRVVDLTANRARELGVWHYAPTPRAVSSAG